MKLDTALFGEREAIQIRRDLVDVQIAVCSLEVLVTFSDNFDYQAGPLAGCAGHRRCQCWAACTRGSPRRQAPPSLACRRQVMHACPITASQ